MNGIYLAEPGGNDYYSRISSDPIDRIVNKVLSTITDYARQYSRGDHPAELILNQQTLLLHTISRLSNRLIEDQKGALDSLWHEAESLK